MIWRHSGLLSEKPIACGCGLLLEETSIPILSEGYLTIFGKIQFPEETTLLGSFFWNHTGLQSLQVSIKLDFIATTCSLCSP
jgi:hypothetical protein